MLPGLVDLVVQAFCEDGHWSEQKECTVGIISIIRSLCV